MSFLYFKATLRVNSRTNVLFQTEFIVYQIDDIITVDIIAITMEETPCIIFSVGDTTCEIIRTHKIFFANVTFIAANDRISSNNLFGWGTEMVLITLLMTSSF